MQCSVFYTRPALLISNQMVHCPAAVAKCQHPCWVTLSCLTHCDSILNQVCFGCCYSCAFVSSHVRRRKNYTPRFNIAGKAMEQKNSSYWDNVDWDAPKLPFVLDKWYYKVVFLVLLVGVTVYVNWHYAASSGRSIQ
eukprot:GHRR01014877.1.p1 GENE.GHRR01014877.1~~GHRR01014877.1.p1  ORF type:complete len:137 (+),score=12.90 GHRR01014877.1:513-923(+)